MDRTLATFKEAEDRVKISHFTKQGYEITGLVHVGANDGYEIEFYLKMGIKPILAIEPLLKCRKILWQKFNQNPDVTILDCALGNVQGQVELKVTDGDGKGSSVLPEIRPAGKTVSQPVLMLRYTDLALPSDRANCLVIDVQGMELDVLRGMDDEITNFDFICVECSEHPIYKGEASAWEVTNYLSTRGFLRETEIAAHDDVMFINRNVLYPPAAKKPLPTGDKLNIGSGQRRFEGHGWINIDAVSRPGQVPDLVLDAGKDPLPYPDNSMNYVVLHQVYEHFGCGEGHALIKEIHRVLKPEAGVLIVTVPNMIALAGAWLNGKIDDYIFMVNTYGAYQGFDSDRHKWGYKLDGLIADLFGAAPWFAVGRPSEPKNIPGADIARDWWILEVEAYK